MEVFKYRNCALSLLALILIMSCSRRIITSNKDNDYVPYSEVLSIKEIDIIHAGLKSIMIDFIQDLEIFENGVNSYSPYHIDYFVSAESFCRNDSSFVVLKARAGSYLFYGHLDELDKRKLEQFRIVKGEEKQILVAKDIEDSLCMDLGEDIYKESKKEGEFRLNWYKKSNGDRLIDFHPYFFQIYHLNREGIVRVELNFPKRIQE